MPFLTISLKSNLHVFVVCSACRAIACWCVQVTGYFAGMLVPRLTLSPLFLGKVCRSFYAVFTSFATVVNPPNSGIWNKCSSSLWILCTNPKLQHLDSNMNTYGWLCSTCCVMGSATLACCGIEGKHYTVLLTCSCISCFHSVLLPLLRSPSVGTEVYLRTETSLKS